MDIDKLRKNELEILDEFSMFCEEHNLKYSLFSGTMLGAVRHGGFIPWDDDIDVIMPREDYEYFIRNWNIPGYVVQNKKVNEDFTQNFTKIRKENTTFIQYEWEKAVGYHTGIFIDIFPADRVPISSIARKLQVIACAINLLYSREYASDGKTRGLEKILLLLPHRLRMRVIGYTEKIISMWNHNKTYSYFLHVTIDDVFQIYPASIFDSLPFIPYEDKQYRCIEDSGRILEILYGDYMKLPPIEEQVLKHHPLVVDFHNNWHR